MRLEWDKAGERVYEAGVDHGVLYLVDKSGVYGTGVVWNGLTAVNENPTGAESNPQYADNVKYLDLYSVEEYEATIEAFTYPEEFHQCDGNAELLPGVYIGQQERKPFGFSYRTKIGNDTEGDNYGYKLHLVYGAKASPSERNYETINDSPEAINFSWEITTTPVNVAGHQPTAHMEIDSTKFDKTKMAALEDILYGTEEKEARMPLPDEVYTLFKGEEAAG